MDPEVQALGVQLADTAVRNTAGAIADRIRAAKARKQDQETITEFEEIIGGLLADKNELIRIAQAYEQELVAQRISSSDIAYISDNIVPILRQLLESAAAGRGEDPSSVETMIDLVQPILSVETVTVLQLIGFNFRKAIGEPLTILVGQLIASRVHADASTAAEIQRLGLMREVAYLDVARDPDAYSRLTSMMGQQNERDKVSDG